MSPTFYRRYVLSALLIVYVTGFLDRILIGILGEPVRREFLLSDWHMGLLSGPVFAILYTLLGIPAAFLSERHDRRLIIGIACALWSGMTLCCGLAVTPLQFALARIGVGIGEAGCTPPSHALISEYYPKESRGTALAVYALGVPLGVMLASLLGVYVDSSGDWRRAFILMGVLGILVSLVFVLTVRDPAVGRVSAAVDWRSSIGVVLSERSFVYTALGGSVAALGGYGALQFAVPFWTRVHGLSLSEASLLHGLLFGLFAGIGTFLAGPLSDRWARRDERAYGRLAAYGLLLSVPCYLFGYNTAWLGYWGLWLSLLFFMLGVLSHYLYLSPMFTLTQNAVEPGLRAVAAALLLFFVNVIGYVFGPPLTGFLSDLGASWHLSSLGSGMDLALCDAQADRFLPCMQARALGVRFALSAGVASYALAALFFLCAGVRKR